MNVDCNLKVPNHLGLFSSRPVGVVKIEGKKYVAKKHRFTREGKEPYEYVFYQKSLEKSKEDGMDKILSMPVHIVHCPDYKIYIYNVISKNFSSKKFYKFSFEDFIDYTIQLCLQIYYLNHHLGFFNNDIVMNGKLRNVMIDYHKSGEIKFDKYHYKIKKHMIKVIDFGQSKTYPNFRTLSFYSKTGFQFKSEVFIVYYLCFAHYKKSFADKNYMYQNILNIMKERKKDETLLNFDKTIINKILSIQKTLKN